MESQVADPSNLAHGGNKLNLQVFDRWIFVLMATLLLATVLTGFIPSSIEKVAAVQSGERAPFLSVLHVHAALMGSWILLLLTQASLIANNNRALHQKLGMASMVLVPAIVIAGFVLVPQNFKIVWALDPANFPTGLVAAQKEIISNIALAQIRIGILFPVFVALALYFRKKDSGTHKRLMILATVMPIPAALDRISWLPNTMPNSPIAPDLYILLLILPMVAYDLLRNNGVPRAYVYWAAGFIPSSVVINLLWSSSWWLSTAPKIMGVEG